ncbi:glycosyltransferase [Hyphobacterium sp. SN044]|uniref:glycosyltransferase n=1 Tax=Hyphobacterium sp. SN044 TaxID=2912575 RepID=UPI001F3FF03C|nr:glycosyltransferase [Hyphobacterium sp. SN044]
MIILITNHGLDGRAGTELYVRDLALGLKAAGHTPVCFAPVLGIVAEEIRAAGIEVTDTLDGLAAPDILHGHHHHTTALACLAFPQTPALFVCHGVLPWQEAPLAQFSNIRRYAAVSEACRRKLLDAGVPGDRIMLRLNGFDSGRFKRGEPAANDAGRKTRALLFSNIAQPADLLPFMKACGAQGLALDFAGRAGKVLGTPEDELPRYGLVFAKARAAIEAMASGCAVILADYGKIGPLVTTANFDALRQENFGIAAITDPPDEAALREAIAGIDWDDAARVSARVRAEAPFANTVADYLADYEAIGADGPADASRIGAEASAYLAAILPHLSERDALAGRLYHETKTRLDRDRELAALIVRAKSDPAAFNELLERARWLDPSNADLKG